MRYIIPRIFASIYCRISGNWKKKWLPFMQDIACPFGTLSGQRLYNSRASWTKSACAVPSWHATRGTTSVAGPRGSITILHPKEMQPFSIMFENHSKSNLFQCVPMGMFACSISGATVMFNCCIICCIVEFDRARRGLVFEKLFWTSRFFTSFFWQGGTIRC